MSVSRLFAFLAPVALVAALLAAPWLGASQPPTANAAAPAAPADTLTLIATQDSWVDEAAPSATHGTDPELHVGRTSDQRAAYQRQTLVAFDLSKLPADASVTKATLELYQIKAAGAERYNIWPDAIFDGWNEMSVTWGGKPPASNVGDPPSTLDYSNGVKQWDVTKIVQNWAVGEIKNYGILLRGDGDTLGLRVFGSLNGQVPPRLIIEYATRNTRTPTATATRRATNTPTATATPQTQRPVPDLGDAPDSTNSFGAVMSAYPAVPARFPSVFGAGSPPHGPLHRNDPLLFHLGKNITAETEADAGGDADGVNNLRPPANTANLDGADDGLSLPGSFGHCQKIRLQYTVTVYPGAPKEVYVNLWFDWTRNGWWSEVPKCYPGTTSAVAPEWAVQNQVIALPGPGTHTFTTPTFLPYNPDPARPLWLRITISESPAAAPDGSGPAGAWRYGETEDYLMHGTTHEGTPTRTPVPTWTPIPTKTPTPGPTATPTPPIIAVPYVPVKPVIFPGIFQPDLSIFGVEITQGVQCFDTSKGLGGCADNSLAVVAKKDTTARIYLKYSGILSSLNSVPVRLHIFADGVEYIANTSGKAVKTLNQANSDDARVYFNVNFSNDVPVSFYAEVDPDNTISETNEGNNRYPASGTITLNFRKRDTLKIVGQRLRYHPSGYTGTQYAGGWAVNGGAADWLEQLLPLRNNGINYSVKSGYLDWTTTLNSNGQHDLIKTLNTMWILENVFSWLFGSGAFTGADHVYGWAPNDGYSGGHADMPVYPHAGGLGVVGIGTDAPGTSTDNPGAGALIFGHELVHDYNVYHTNTADACGSSDGNSDFPYSSSSIQEFGFNPITGKIYNPSSTHDLMSYCPSGGSKEGWISPFTWNKMFNNFSALAMSAASAPGEPRTGVFQTTASSESLVVNATLYNPDVPNEGGGKLGEFDELYKVEGGLAYALPSGDYAVELRDGQNVLRRETFAVSFESEYDQHGSEPGDPDPRPEMGVSFIMPWEAGTTSVVLLHGEQVLDERAVSAGAPNVTITSPSGPATWPAGSNQTLTWTGSDPDGDALSYSVFYSHDAGASWVILATGLTSQSFEVSVDSLAGGSDVRFRVVATDGINTGHDETDAAISVPNKAPEAIITGPVMGHVVTPGALVVLQGTATDLEDGGLPDEALQWSSDRQGGLGTGPSVALNSLEAGEHTITLTAIDSNGQTASASVEIFVGHRVYLPITTKP